MFDRQSIHVALLLWGAIFCLIAAYCMFISSTFDKEKRRWLICFLSGSALLLVSDTFAWGYRGAAGKTAAVMVRVSNFGAFILNDILLFFFHGYVCCYLFPEIGEWRKYLTKKYLKGSSVSKPEKIVQSVPRKRILAVYFITVFASVMTIISQFTHLYYYIDAENYYHRAPGHIISLLIPMCGMVLDLSLIIQYRKKLEKGIFIAMLSYLVLPFASAVVLIFYYGISLNDIALSISAILMFVTSTAEQNKNLARKEQEAANMRVSIMISQIRPHFMYNCLNTIYHLCDKDVELAKEAISDFLDYLKHILESVKRNTPVSFSEELEHVRAYLNLEKMRFDEDLNIRYDIEATEFLVPALSIQPLVENAVKHGICGKEDGGTLTLSTREKEDYFEIEVADDGIGFDPEQMPQDGKIHVGIQNVKQRLYAMCGASVEIKSKIGEGTIVTVHIPKDQRLQ